jgi:hypothetical protein
MTALIIVMLISLSMTAGAHCDTMDGPVVKAAKITHDKSDVTPVIRWIKKEYEDEVRSAFKQTLEVRTKGKEARELADMYFFETLVRLHRAGEGEPYTGLKPAGTPIEPIVLAADKALETGSSKKLTELLTSAAEEGVVVRFKHAVEAKKEVEKSVEAGREFVEAYVEFVHYAEQLFELIHKPENEQAHGENITPAH